MAYATNLVATWGNAEGPRLMPGALGYTVYLVVDGEGTSRFFGRESWGSSIGGRSGIGRRAGGGIEITTEIKIEITGGTTTSVTPIDGARTGKTGNADRTHRHPTGGAARASTGSARRYGLEPSQRRRRRQWRRRRHTSEARRCSAACAAAWHGRRSNAPASGGCTFVVVVVFIRRRHRRRARVTSHTSRQSGGRDQRARRGARTVDARPVHGREADLAVNTYDVTCSRIRSYRNKIFGLKHEDRTSFFARAVFLSRVA